jgi:radical SAM protein with 4Fe4S-binding SPASM domain
MQTIKNDTTNVTKILTERADPNQILIGEIGPSFRTYREAWGRAEQLELVQDFPLHLDFEIRYGCNLRCPMCVVSLSATERGDLEHPKDHIGLEQFRTMMADGVRRGLRAISLNGNNEPLLTPNLHEYVRAAKEAGVLDIMFHTNALLLSEEASENLLEAGLTRIMFSLDAITKETYDQIRIGSDFDRVMRNINYFLGRKKAMGRLLPLTRVSFVESKLNEHELVEFIDYWKGRVDFLTVQQFFNFFAGRKEAQEVERTFRIQRGRTAASGTTDPLMAKCPQPFQRLFVRNDGNVFACCSQFQEPENLMGNVHERSLQEIWNSERMRAFRRKTNALPKEQNAVCVKCRQSLAPMVAPDDLA